MNTPGNFNQSYIKNKLQEIEQARNEFHGHGEVVSEQRLKLMQEIAPKYGVDIKVAGKSGDNYVSDAGYTGKLKDGDFFVGISAEKGQHVNDFWKEFDAKMQESMGKKYDL